MPLLIGWSNCSKKFFCDLEDLFLFLREVTDLEGTVAAERERRIGNENATPVPTRAAKLKNIRAHVHIYGTVQGVYYRQNTKQVANRHSVKGLVRNLSDGRVEAIFEGNELDVNEVIEWCHVGPPKARVEDVRVKYEKYTGEFSAFEVDY